ncbi:MAG TPA: type VI immunity family protein [Archangium sp.]|uniref:type VI immunity family protein n=1 Tax=Archangium sp. TaxID=1872627 RepID=UPI002E2FEF08|nr:type VI immunity family protein [Archangium sp.]HEX5749922.1 type VI immunity family protein [Archangium sp.]
MRRPHTQMARAVMRSMDTYLNAVGAEHFAFYVDDEGDCQELDAEGWAFIRRHLLEDPWPRVILMEGCTVGPEQYRFEYQGRRIDDPKWRGSDKYACAASFWLPTEYLEEHGPECVRALALDLAAPLPFCSGNGGLAFLGPNDAVGVTEEIRERCFRYPGMDIPAVESFSYNIGTRVRGPSWLTFLGQPVLGELGGVEALRARLHSPGTTVQDLDGGRAVVTLGEWPDSGDTEQGRTLPAYRELARVLEPWHYEGPEYDKDFTPEERRRWERRFLD